MTAARGGRDWTRMQRADFDPAAPLALVDVRAVPRRVDAVAHANGTDALFGDEPTSPRATRTRTRTPAVPSTPQDDTLF